MQSNLESVVKSGWHYKDNEIKLIRFFKEVNEKYPNNARAKFELASTYDYLGKEDQAIPLYEDAIKIGLTAEYEGYALLQLGGSLRNVGRIDDAIRVLSDAEKRHPELPSISIFLAVALHDIGRHSEALRKALTVMMRHLKTSDISSTDNQKQYGNNFNFALHLCSSNPFFISKHA